LFTGPFATILAVRPFEIAVAASFRFVLDAGGSFDCRFFLWLGLAYLCLGLALDGLTAGAKLFLHDPAETVELVAVHKLFLLL
jgi:hypothetical protein